MNVRWIVPVPAVEDDLRRPLRRRQTVLEKEETVRGRWKRLKNPDLVSSPTEQGEGTGGQPQRLPGTQGHQILLLGTVPAETAVVEGKAVSVVNAERDTHEKPPFSDLYCIQAA